MRFSEFFVTFALVIPPLTVKNRPCQLIWGFKNICVLVHWMEVVLALGGLNPHYNPGLIMPEYICKTRVNPYAAGAAGHYKLQMKDPLELFVKSREFLHGSGFLSRRDMT